MGDIKKVAVIGAGVPGVSAAVHLHQAGVEVTVFERGAKAGGVWVYDDRISKEPLYPSVLPSVGDSPEYERYIALHAENETSELGKARENRQDSPMTNEKHLDESELALLHAPPGPCYASLMNNVSTTEMELRANKWKPGTEDFVKHHVLAEYIQDTAKNTHIEPRIRFNTRVDAVEKTGSQWNVQTSKLVDDNGSRRLSVSSETFDAVVVASGHYHACNIPDTPGLKEWKQRWPDRVRHSKCYRNASGFENQNVLLVGSGVSSWDIAREIGPVVKVLYQVSRGGAYDLPAALFPSNTIRIGDIASYEAVPDEISLAEDGCLPGTVYLKSGHKICGIHQVVLATGYHMSYPFLSGHHSDATSPEDADERVLVTKDGQRAHNLHKDIFYIPDPTLAFIGVPYHVATFSLFEFQAITLAAVYSGRSSLPSEVEMRKEYNQKLAEKGAGRAFHSLKDSQGEIRYVDDLIKLVNQNAETDGREKILGHSEAWRNAYARRWDRIKERVEQAPPREDISLDELLNPSAALCT